MDLPDLLHTSRIVCQADVQSKKRALEAIAALLTDSIDDEDVSEMVILDALNNRERLGCTSLGHGVGLPHSRCEFVDKPIAALLTTKEGIDYDATDGQPVDLFVGLLVPEACNDEHLKILATLAKRFNDDGFREALRSFSDPESLYTGIGGQVVAGEEEASNSGTDNSVTESNTASKNNS